MFYPVDSLRKGGRFYLLWLADSWPHRFATISQRQLWSQDVRKLCDELIDVMISESGRPTHRYSLRLSSQLLRGLVRVYQRKVSVFLSDLCMIHANVIKHSNKRTTNRTTDQPSQYHQLSLKSHRYQEVTEQTRDKPQRQVVKHQRTAAGLEDENEHRVEEILQNSTNVVANIQDITLREAVINEPILPPNEGFGEENAEQVLQFLANRSVEQMLAPTDSVAQHSALELPYNITDKSHDTLLPAHARMEQISGLDFTLLRPSDGGLLSVTDLGKEIPNISDVPILPIPELPDPQEKQPQEAVVEPEVAIVQPREQPRGTEREIVREPTQIELEELEEIEPRAKRRRKLIIDKIIKISSDDFRAQIENPRVELRDEKSSKAKFVVLVPAVLYMNRPCHGGVKIRSTIAPALTRMFMRNLGVVNKERANSEFEVEEMQRPQNYLTRSHLEHILEVTGPSVAIEPQIEIVPETSAVVEGNIPEMGGNVGGIDIADMVTQKLETLSQNKEKGKRTSDESTPSPKKRKSGYVSLRDNQERMRESEISISAHTETEKLPELVTEVDKENIAANKQALTTRISKRAGQRTVTTMLYEAGLSDIPGQPPTEKEPVPSQAKQSKRLGSETSESLLGSLDRTKVSLGDSDTTTDSKRFIRDQWGTEGTMLKIIKYLNLRRRGESITIPKLVERGPIIYELKNIIIAKCFSSILKLKQHGFITIRKCPVTLEILDIMLGPSFQL